MKTLNSAVRRDDSLSQLVVVREYSRSLGCGLFKEDLLLDRPFPWQMLSGVLKLDFPGKKIPGSPTEPANVRLGGWLTWMRIKNNSIVRLFVDFPDVIGLTRGSSYDNATSHFVGVVTPKRIYPQFYRHFCHSGFCCCCSSVMAVSAAWNVTLHRVAAFPAGSGNGVKRWFLAGWPTLKEPV